MIILLIIGILLTGLAIGSLARVTIWPRGGHMRSAGVPRRVEEYGFTKRDHGEETSGGLREKLDDVATSLGSADLRGYFVELPLDAAAFGLRLGALSEAVPVVSTQQPGRPLAKPRRQEGGCDDSDCETAEDDADDGKDDHGVRP